MDTNSIKYPYYDENKRLLYSKVRIEREHKKTFYSEHEENGITIKNLNGCRKILYQLPCLLLGISKNQTIFLVEGEKDVDTLISNRLIATTSPGSLEWCPEFTQTLKDADVVILYDNDKTGLKRRDLLCKNLYGHVKRLRVVDLPGLEYKDSHGLDISDWLQMGNNIEQFKDLVEQASDYESHKKQEAGKLNPVAIEDFLSLTLPEREMLLSPFLPSQGLALLVAKRGVGKTHVALGIAYAVASGGTFLNWASPAPKKVLYVDGEMPAVLMQERLHMITTMNTKHPAPDFLKLLTPDLQDRVMPNFSCQDDRDEIEPLLEEADLIIIDNISCLFRSGGENESESWQEAQEWALDLRRRGKSVLFVHHAGKNGTQRGTSKREDTLDTVIILKHPDDYKAEEGARFEVHFDKARHFAGDDARSFQAQLKTENGITEWEISDAPEEEEIQLIATMRNEKKTIKEITKETGLSKSQVEYRMAKAKEKGLIVKQQIS